MKKALILTFIVMITTLIICVRYSPRWVNKTFYISLRYVGHEVASKIVLDPNFNISEENYTVDVVTNVSRYVPYNLILVSSDVDVLPMGSVLDGVIEMKIYDEMNLLYSFKGSGLSSEPLHRYGNINDLGAKTISGVSGFRIMQLPVLKKVHSDKVRFEIWVTIPSTRKRIFKNMTLVLIPDTNL